MEELGGSARRAHSPRRPPLRVQKSGEGVAYALVVGPCSTCDDFKQLRQVFVRLALGLACCRRRCDRCLCYGRRRPVAKAAECREEVSQRQVRRRSFVRFSRTSARSRLCARVCVLVCTRLCDDFYSPHRRRTFLSVWSPSGARGRAERRRKRVIVWKTLANHIALCGRV